MLRNDLLNMLHQGLAEMDQSLDRQTESRLIHYIELIAQWNRMYNLSSIRDIDTMVTRHLLDSLSILSHIEGKTVLDVGTGAGLPGIPLAIAMPGLQFVLLDTNQKKTKFLQQVRYQMRLDNVRVIQERVEQYQASSLFDSVISRGFSTLREFLTLSQHLIKPGGQLLAMKGVFPLTELQEVTHPFNLVEVKQLKIPKLDAERHFVHFRYLPEMEAKAETLMA